ncbi:MAG TPA: hypothetical protein VLB12_16700 [Gemmatimonadales bacterium]|jgi:hypothetical protein|nr:hypothetical protein [Gemmatimonadales bacterium]
MARRTLAGKALDQSDAARCARRLNIEHLIDETVAQSFPASDPPAWGVIAALLEREGGEPGGMAGPAGG